LFDFARESAYVMKMFKIIKKGKFKANETFFALSSLKASRLMSLIIKINFCG